MSDNTTTIGFADEFTRTFGDSRFIQMTFKVWKPFTDIAQVFCGFDTAKPKVKILDSNGSGLTLTVRTIEDQQSYLSNPLQKQQKKTKLSDIPYAQVHDIATQEDLDYYMNESNVRYLDRENLVLLTEEEFQAIENAEDSVYLIAQ